MSVDMIAELDELAERRAAFDVIRLEYERKRADILAVVQPQLDDLDREYKPRLATAELHAAQLEGEVKALVIALGESVKGTQLHAVYSKGRVTWDTRGLDGYAVAHPELAAFRKVGDPSVTIRAAK